jgi:activator of HSP90 ATPase
MAQRGIQADDIELIMTFGTEVHEGFLVRDKDIQEIERVLKRLVQRLQRVRGKRIVTREDTLVTAFHARGRQARELLRESKRSGSCGEGGAAWH